MKRLEEEGRLLYHQQSQFLWSLDTLVRKGRHVLVDADITITNLVASDYSATGIDSPLVCRSLLLPTGVLCTNDQQISVTF